MWDHIIPIIGRGVLAVGDHVARFAAREVFMYLGRDVLRCAVRDLLAFVATLATAL